MSSSKSTTPSEAFVTRSCCCELTSPPAVARVRNRLTCGPNSLELWSAASVSCLLPLPEPLVIVRDCSVPRLQARLGHERVQDLQTLLVNYLVFELDKRLTVRTNLRGFSLLPVLAAIFAFRPMNHLAPKESSGDGISEPVPEAAEQFRMPHCDVAWVRHLIPRTASPEPLSQGLRLAPSGWLGIQLACIFARQAIDKAAACNFNLPPSTPISCEAAHHPASGQQQYR
jgi:hypothetical protein